jgi:hydroxypyruvate isomerase
MENCISRRSLLQGLAGGTAAVAAMSWVGPVEAAEVEPVKLKGNVNHSVCRWCYGAIPLDELCKAARQIGLKSVELVGPDEWPTLAKTSITCRSWKAI